MKVHGDALTIEIAGANVTIPAPTIAELWLERVKESATSARLRELRDERTSIGTLGLEGIYAGVARGPEDGDDHILEVIEQETSKEKLTWQEAMAWAESVGGALPTRREAALLYANVPELFEKTWYWTCEQYAGYESYAWYQDFYYGHQDYDHKDTELRARAVRRLPLAI